MSSSSAEQSFSACSTPSLESDSDLNRGGPPRTRQAVRKRSISAHLSQESQQGSGSANDDTEEQPVVKRGRGARGRISGTTRGGRHGGRRGGRSGVAVTSTTAAAKEKATDVKRPSTVRCSPQTFKYFVSSLNDDHRRRIEEMGFSGILNLAADKLDSRDMLSWLMDKLNPETIVLEISPEKRLLVSKEAVHCVHGLPAGDARVPSVTDAVAKWQVEQ
ncbi:hypothetical protein ACP4OV_031716 [Aristida adscensionis]